MVYKITMNAEAEEDFLFNLIYSYLYNSVIEQYLFILIFLLFYIFSTLFIFNKPQ